MRCWETDNTHFLLALTWADLKVQSYYKNVQHQRRCKSFFDCESCGDERVFEERQRFFVIGCSAGFFTTAANRAVTRQGICPHWWNWAGGRGGSGLQKSQQDLADRSWESQSTLSWADLVQHSYSISGDQSNEMQLASGCIGSSA